MSFLWYDLETFGRRADVDRIAEFSALRTNERFEVVGEPVTIYGKLSPDYLPDPQACIITGLTPQEVNEKGVCEAEMARGVDALMIQPGTCTLGYNSIRFDDEFIRNLMYRNFHDPYRREWAEGNSRWDIIGLARAARDLRPEGIEWPLDDEGKPSMRLELLSRANGLGHENPHEALSDVYATLALGRLIHEKQPRLFEWGFNHRMARQIRPLISLDSPESLVYTGSGVERGTTLILPLVADLTNKNKIYFFDLRQDPGDLLELPEDELCRRVFTSGKSLEAEGVERVRLLGLSINRCPFLAPQGVLSEGRAGELGIDMKAVRENCRRLKSAPDLLRRLYRVLEIEGRENYSVLSSDEAGQGGGSSQLDDTDFQIYSGFFPDADNELMKRVREASPEELASINPDALDKRFPEMLRRYVGRNFPQVMDEKAALRWRSFCASRILFQSGGANALAEFRKRLDKWRNDDDLPAGKKVVIKCLGDYADYLENELLR